MAWIEDWPAVAACRTTDPDALFVQGAAQNRAKTFCMGCPGAHRMFGGRIGQRCRIRGLGRNDRARAPRIAAPPTDCYVVASTAAGGP